MIPPLNRWLFVLMAVLIGHFGIHLAIYNRVNAIGLSRRTTRVITKSFFALAMAIPLLVWLRCRDVIGIFLAEGSLRSGDGSTEMPTYVAAYAAICLASWMFLGIPWLLWRPILGLEWVKAPRRIQTCDVQRLSRQPLALTLRCKLESRLPLNQIFELSIEEITLPVVGLPPSWQGYRIAQLSDIHLTGHVHPDYARFVVREATGWQPDMMLLCGDIIDKQRCVDWLPDIFSQAQSSDGCYFVLGNHDTRIRDARQTRRAMDQAGWTDLGNSQVLRQIRGQRVRLIGNEYPWFDRPKVDPIDEPEFRILVSHSPDQIWWARRNAVQLMFAGHTHGGQGRLPLVGPLLSPSYHGSRFASGDFFKAPTTMHVSRGLGGCHLLRVHCRPELSLVTLTNRVPSIAG